MSRLFASDPTLPIAELSDPLPIVPIAEGPVLAPVAGLLIPGVAPLLVPAAGALPAAAAACEIPLAGTTAIASAVLIARLFILGSLATGSKGHARAAFIDCSTARP